MKFSHNKQWFLLNGINNLKQAVILTLKNMEAVKEVSRVRENRK